MASEGGMGSRAAFPLSRVGGEGGDHHSASTKPVLPERASFTGDKLFSGDRDSRSLGNFHRPLPINQSWGPPTIGGSPVGGCGSEDDDYEDEDDEDDIDDGDGLVSLEEEGNKAANNSSGSMRSSSERVRYRTADSKPPYSSFVLGDKGGGCNGGDGGAAKDINGGRENSEARQYRLSRMDAYADVVSVAHGEPYYMHGLHSGDTLSPAHKEVGTENGCSSSGRKEVGSAGRYWETLRNYLSDPLTAVLMDDAMILSCGHSFGSGGMQHVYKLKACPNCSQPISEGSVRPNLALRAAVQAFLREEESQSFRPSKRRKERLEQEKCNYNDPCFMDLSRGKGVQFPFSVSDKVIIKGNKRTPLRFVGRIAVVTAQCLNGWFVVKTLDNAESVKLQYRSLAKVSDDHTSNVRTPHWL